MEALDQLLMACHCQSINLFVESFLKMVAKLLESEKPNLQILGTNSVSSSAAGGGSTLLTLSLTFHPACHPHFSAQCQGRKPRWERMGSGCRGGFVMSPLVCPAARDVSEIPAVPPVRCLCRLLSVTRRWSLISAAMPSLS